MTTHDSRARPWLAAGLSVAVTGLGHLYLREWVRALMWFGLAFTAALLFVDEGSAVALVESGVLPPLAELAPVLVVRLLSVADAYRFALVRNADAAGEGVRCPSCGKRARSDIEFCQWCTEPLPAERATSR